jgi:hypothetical protein
MYDFDTAAFTVPARVRLYHFEDGQWVDRTVRVDPLAGRVCGVTSSLPPFAVAEPIGGELAARVSRAV